MSYLTQALDQLHEDYPQAKSTTLRFSTKTKYIAFYNTGTDRITINRKDRPIIRNKTKAYWLLVLFHEYAHALQNKMGVMTEDTGKMYKSSKLNDVKIQIEKDADMFAIKRYFTKYARTLGRNGLEGYFTFCEVRGKWLPRDPAELPRQLIW